MGTRGGKKSAKKDKGRKSSRAANPMVTFQRVTIDDRLGSDERFWATVIGKCRPRAAAAEPVADIAIFDDDVLEQCDQTLREEVQAVRDALSLVSSGQDEAARDRVSAISRRSELSEWRLLVRFLAEWYADQFDAAKVTYGKLSEGRRPWKIARNLSSASDQHFSGEAVKNRYLSIPKGEIPQQAIVEGVRRVRFERPAIGELERLLTQQDAGRYGKKLDEAKQNLPAIDDKTGRLLESFCQRYRVLESQLVDAILSNARRALRLHDDSDVFERFVSKTPGPFFDVNHNLLRHLHYKTFVDGDQDAERAMVTYLDEVRQNGWVSGSLADAWFSYLFCRIAEEKKQVIDQMAGPLGFPMLQEAGIDPEVRLEAEEAVLNFVATSCLYYPENRAAQALRIRILEDLLEASSKVSEQKLVNKRISEANVQFADAFPNELKPRLWLVDYFLENDQPEKAEPYAKQLVDARASNVRVLLVPWKQALIGAMNAARRKSSLKSSAELLEQADKLWPNWIDKKWLAYLQAALQMRLGDSAGREFADSQNTLEHYVAMLSAAQKMNVPAGELKIFRERVQQAVDGDSDWSFAQLLDTAVFLHHLSRAGISYPAYRSHGGRIEKLVVKAIAKKNWKTLSDLGKPFHETLYWLAEQGTFDQKRQSPLAKRVSANGSEWLNAVLNTISFRRRKPYFIDSNYEGQLNALEAHISKEGDQYLRIWFGELLEDGKAIFETFKESLQFGFGGRFGSAFEAMARAVAGGYADEYDDEDDDDDDEMFDPQCKCPRCVEARRRQAAANGADGARGASGSSRLNSNEWDDDYEYPFYEEDLDERDGGFRGMDRSAGSSASGPRPTPDPKAGEEIKRTRPKQPLGKKNKKNKK